MNKAIRAILRYLFQEYVKGPNVAYAINAVAVLHNVDPVAISEYLLEKNWIRERWIFQDNLVSCRITVAGIEEVAPAFIRNKLRQIIGSLLDSGGAMDLGEIFQNKINEYATNLDIVIQLEKLAMVRMEHQHGCIIISLTDHGRQFFAKKRNSLFTLVSIA